MAEQAPEMRPTPKDERDKAAKLKAQYEEAQFLADQLETFGAFDVTAPNEGEDTYQSYLDKRPTEGVLRDGEGYREAQSGKFASGVAYEAQNGTAQDYYDQKGGLVNTTEYQAPNYEEMGVLQLAKEAAKARQLGDRATEEEVRAAVEHYLTNDAMKDDSESPEEAQARYDDELNRYEQLVDRFVARGESNHAGEQHEPSANGEGNPSQRAATSQETSEEATSAGAPETVESSSEETTEAAPEKASVLDTTEVYFGDEKVEVGNVFESPSGDKAVEIITSDGKKQVVYESELAYKEKPAEEASAPEEKAETAALAVDSKGEIEVLDEELAAQTKDLAPDPRVEQERNAEKSRLDKLKDWFSKERKTMQEFGGKAYWSGKWMSLKEGVLNIGVQEGMTDEEIESKRRRNRIMALSGVCVLAAGAIGAIGFGVGHAVGASEAHGATGGEIPGAGTGSGTGHQVNEHMRDVLDGSQGTTGTEIAPTPEVTPPAEAFNIPSGGGGEQLFDNLGIDPTKWYANENSLLSQFPNDFYRMDSGHVGISHPGMLSQGAQNFINSLK